MPSPNTWSGCARRLRKTSTRSGRCRPARSASRRFQRVPYVWGMVRWLRERRRRRLLAEPFPEAWDRIIDDNVAVARYLRPETRARLRELVQVFVAEKHWEGCGGLEVTDEIKVTIAAQACRLVLGRGDQLFDDVASILVYPSTVIVPPGPMPTFGQVMAPVSHGGTTVLGQAMLGGPVVLAWDAVLAGAREDTHGNVTLHEFAHKLDMAHGRIDGTPPLRSRT